MSTLTGIGQKTLTFELAEAISKFNIIDIGNLLKENGEFMTLDEKDERVVSSKDDFIKWISNCFDEFKAANEDRNKLDYTIDQCLHCRIGNPVIIFENGRFPVFTRETYEREKCGMMLEFGDDLISDISFCYFFLITDNPFNFERECTRRYGVNK